MEALEPKGKRTARIESVAELEIDCAIQIKAEQLAGVQPGAEVPYGFRARAIRELLISGAMHEQVAREANRRAAEIRERESRE